ncbi:hypothetical protein LCGC14_1438810 [marine sediment metagenome]|uniref:Uncharacterized protein n=1 Tax=marine sediment metagenome TaxID=412755 RepID=A0A0F9JLU5_9ZZZZ
MYTFKHIPHPVHTQPDLVAHDGQECIVFDTYHEPDYNHEQPTHSVRFADGYRTDVANNELIGEPRPEITRHTGECDSEDTWQCLTCITMLCSCTAASDNPDYCEPCIRLGRSNVS